MADAQTAHETQVFKIQPHRWNGSQLSVKRDVKVSLVRLAIIQIFCWSGLTVRDTIRQEKQQTNKGLTGHEIFLESVG